MSKSFKSFEKTDNIDDVARSIAEFLFLDIKNEKIIEYVSEIRRELADIKYFKWDYPLTRILDVFGVKNYLLRLNAKELNKINKDYFPLISYSEELGWIQINSSFFYRFEVFSFKTKETYKMSSKKLIDICRNNEGGSEFIIFENGVPIQMLNSKHEHESPRRKLLRILFSEKKDLLIIFAYSLIISILSLVIPIAIQSLVNTIAFATLLQPLIVLTFLVISALGFESILRILRTYVVEILQRRIFVKVASDLSHRIPKVKLSEFDKHHGPEIVNRFFDVLTVQKSSATLLVDGLSIVLQTITGMILLAFYHPFLLGFDLVLSLFLMIIVLVLTRNGMETSIKESKLKYKVAAWLEELASHNILFKNPSSYIYGLKKTDALVRDYLQARTKHFNVLFRIFSGSLFLYTMSSSLLLGIGGLLVMDQQLSIGQLVAAELIVTSIVSGVIKFGKQLEVYYDLLSAIDKLSHVVDLEMEKQSGEPISSIEKAIEFSFNNVSFAYSDNPTLLKDLNFKVKSGEMFAIYGDESKGKTTISELILGLRRVKSGLLEINDIDINLMDLNYYRNFVSFINQTEIFHGTILENIRAGRELLKIDEIKDVLVKLKLWDDICLLKNGIDTELSTGGSPLSYAMSLKLMIARALLSNPKLIVLDGILDHLSLDTAKYYLKEIFKPDVDNYTLVITTNNKELLKYCNTIYDLNENKIVDLSNEVL